VGDFPTNYIIHFSFDDIAYTGYQGADEEGCAYGRKSSKIPTIKEYPRSVFTSLSCFVQQAAVVI
jgi:hypothetical protein